MSEQEATLWAQGGAALVAKWDREGPPKGATPAALAKWTEVRNHIHKNVHRTNYPEYRSRGWDVGSGPTEAGCKLLGGRLKGTGMRWNQTASVQVASLKALYASGMGLWDAFWIQKRKQMIR